MPNSSNDSICNLSSFERRLFVPNETFRNCSYVVCIIICIFGMVGNILAFLGLRKAKQSSTTFLLKTLAITDTLFLFVLMNLTINYYIHDGDWRWNSTFGCIYSAFFLSYIWSPMAYFTHTITIWIVVLIGLNRYIIVCYPLYAKRYSRVAIYKISMCIIIFVAFVLCGWRGVFIKVIAVKLQNNLTCYVRTHRFDRSKSIAWLLGGSVDQIVVFVVPFITLLIVTIRLIKALRVAKQRRDRMQVTSQQNRENTITRTLVVVLIVFTICQATLIAQTVVFLYMFVFRTICFEINHLYIDVIVPSLNIFLAFNSSINFVIYIVVNKTYRELMLNTYNHILPSCLENVDCVLYTFSLMNKSRNSPQLTLSIPCSMPR